jgi:hypothetical protein
MQEMHSHITVVPNSAHLIKTMMWGTIIVLQNIRELGGKHVFVILILRKGERETETDQIKPELTEDNKT